VFPEDLLTSAGVAEKTVDESVIQDLQDVLRISQQVLAAFPDQPWWRGHARESWDLVPHVYRRPEYGPRYEANIANTFVKLAPTRHANCPAPGQAARWLFLMQHYGLPTRLLDWTESPLLAVYLALREEQYRDEPGALWALNPFGLNALVLKAEPGLCQPGQEDANELIQLVFTRVPATDDRVIGLVTEEIDLRMMVQLSVFTIHGSPRPLNGRPGIGPAHLQKFTIAGAAKGHLLDQLASLGIRERTVFPDLEHLAADVRRLRY